MLHSTYYLLGEVQSPEMRYIKKTFSNTVHLETIVLHFRNYTNSENVRTSYFISVLYHSHDVALDILEAEQIEESLFTHAFSQVIKAIL